MKSSPSQYCWLNSQLIKCCCKTPMEVGCAHLILGVKLLVRRCARLQLGFLCNSVPNKVWTPNLNQCHAKRMLGDRLPGLSSCLRFAKSAARHPTVLLSLSCMSVTPDILAETCATCFWSACAGEQISSEVSTAGWLFLAPRRPCGLRLCKRKVWTAS